MGEDRGGNNDQLQVFLSLSREDASIYGRSNKSQQLPSRIMGEMPREITVVAAAGTSGREKRRILLARVQM